MRDLIRRRLPAVVLGVVVLVFLSANRVANFVTDLWWYDAAGFRDVFTTILGTRIVVGLVFGLVVGVLVAVNLQVARRLRPFFIPSTPEQAAVERYRQMADPYLPWLILGVAALFAVTSGFAMSAQWEQWLLFLNGQEFGQTDPQFGRDIGFYLFELPFLETAQSWLFTTLLLVTALTAGAHYLLGGIRPEAPTDKVMPNVKVHLSVLLALLLAAQGWGYWLDRYLLNFSPRGTVTGASYTDVNAELPALTMLLLVTVVAIGLTLFNVRRRGFLLPGAAISLLVLANVLLSGAYPAIIQRLQVEPQELNRESEFIDRNIALTNQAYGLSEVELEDFQVTNDLEPADLATESGTFTNIRLWDPDILQTTYQELQSLRPYYAFSDVDVDRYEIDGETRQVMLSARELQQEGLPTNARSWQNETLTYTHGLGVVASRVNVANTEGQPVLLARGIPPSGIPELTTGEVEGGLYYGERTPDAGNPEYNVVNTDQPELNFEDPRTNQQVTRSYDGQGGVRLGAIGSRLAYALRFSDPNLVLSGLLRNDSRIIYHRDVLDRVEMVAPYLELDDDPYPVVLPGQGENGEGDLVWVVDAYTTSNFFPYSQRLQVGEFDNLNYIRNSVKVTVDAYDGTVTLYVVDPDDRVLQSWQDAFPGTYTALDEAPEGLQEHFRYPETLFMVQREIYREYHIREVDDFYNKADVWQLPIDAAAVQNGDTGNPILQPYYLLMRLPGEETEEFVLIQPYLPQNRPNMVAWLAARSDPEHYGELFAVQFANDLEDEDEAILGIQQAQARIEQTDEIQTFIRLNDGGGTTVIRGNMQVIPVNNSIVYVEPLFINSSQADIPELAQVVVIEGDKTVMEPTLAGALRELVNAPEPPPGSGGADGDGEADGGDDADATAQQLLERGLRAFEQADEALREGDLATYQEQVERGRELFERAAQIQGVEVPQAQPDDDGDSNDPNTESQQGEGGDDTEPLPDDGGGGDGGDQADDQIIIEG